MTDELLDIAFAVTTVLEEFGIAYVIGGSLASSVYGFSRLTQDSDIVADIQLTHVPHLVQRLQPEFYISLDAILDAIEHSSSFNLIHLKTLYKVDIFLPKHRPFDQIRFQRGQRRSIEGDSRKAIYSSAEDTILAKLEWYRLGGETSSNQWNDIKGILSVQGNRLDRDYLREMAAELGVEDLLEQAEAEAYT